MTDLIQSKLSALSTTDLAVIVCLSVLLIVLVLAIWTGRRSKTGIELGGMTRGFHVLALALLLLFFGAGGWWAVYVPLSSSAIAAGVVNPEGRRRTVQHLEGGVISAIHVRDGAIVRQGDPLVTLAQIRALAERNAVFYEHMGLLAEQMRLLAEESGADKPAVPDEVARHLEDPEIARLVLLEKNRFRDNMAQRQTRDEILHSRISQLNQQIEGLKKLKVSLEQQTDLVDQEMEAIAPLVEKGLIRLPRMLELRREKARLEGQLEENALSSLTKTEEMGEAKLKLIEANKKDRSEIGAALVEVRKELNRTRAKLPEIDDALARTVVTAPTDGVVVELRFTTVGGVVKPGEAILDLVPEKADLLIEARVKPIDIDNVSPGQDARVTLSAFAQRNMPLINGVVQNVSADRISDPATNESYFLARVKIEPAELKRIRGLSDQDIALVSGMPAEVMIVTGERTMFEYLFDPFTETFRRSFREQ